MKAEALLALYERVADAPDAMARLRRFVLDLAVRGKLVEQDAGDAPASELLARIRESRARLIKNKEIRSPKPVPDAALASWLFQLPPGWTWAPLDNLSPRSLTDGDWIETKDQAEDGNVRLIQLADVGVGAFLDKSRRFVTEQTEARLNCTRLAVDDVLIARLPNPIGRACLFPDIGQPAITAVDVAILRCDKNVDPRYVALAMNAPPSYRQIESYGKGATRFRVSTGHLRTVLVPLPPLAEQQRIVAKVDELMALLDRLEAARSARKIIRDRLTTASLTRLTAPDTDTEALRTHARFALEALPAVTTRADQIKQLRQTILNLAVQGRLAAQSTTDEPASELLQRLSTERARLEQDGWAKRTRGRGETLDPKRSPLPNGWLWARLDDAFLVTGGIQKTPARVPKSNPTPYLGVSNVYRNRIVLSEVKLFEVTPSERARFQLLPHDILVVEGNGSSTEIGRCAIWEGQIEGCVHQNHLIRCRPLDSRVAKFTLLYLNSPSGINEMTRLAITSAGLYSLSVGKVCQVPLPLPPLAEQHRIVAKVNELIALCDRLEAALQSADTTRARLLEALLHEALNNEETELAA